MSDQTSNPAPAVQFTEQLPSQANGISAIASANAPFIFFDGTPNFGINNGVVNVTLEALRFQPGVTGVMMDRVIVAHLRMSIPAAEGLRDSIIKALALLAPPTDPNEVN